MLHVQSKISTTFLGGGEWAATEAVYRYAH